MGKLLGGTSPLNNDEQNVEGLLTADVLRVLERFAVRLTGDGDEAQDLVQDTCIRAWQHREQLRSGSAAQSWLMRIAANLWRDRLRCRAMPTARAEVNELPAATIPLDDRLVAGENVERALSAMEALPPAQRDALYLAAVEGLRRSEIAEILGTTTGAVKVNLSIARRKMREQLGDILEDL
jgi:RNA polymerase sigma-70 factor (ECF subfamily)